MAKNFIEKERVVEIDPEISSKIATRMAPLKSNVLYRVVIFNLNRTTMIDLKDDLIDGAHFANRFKADHITSMAYFMTTHNRYIERESGKPSRQQFQNVVTSDFFGMRLHIVYNWLIGAACLASADGD